MITQLSQVPTPQPIEFKKVDAASPLFSTVKSIFENELRALFGDQAKALSKIGTGENRRCEIALSHGTPVGFLVWKKENEGLNSFVVPNFHVISRETQSISTVGKALADRALKTAQRNGAKNILVTLPEQDSQLLEVLKERNFTILASRNIKSTGFIKNILSSDIKPKTSTLPSNDKVAKEKSENEESTKDIVIKKRRRAEEPVSKPQGSEGIETSRTESSREEHSRKRNAVSDGRDDKPRSYSRSSYDSDRRDSYSNSRSTSDRRDEPRRGVPISGPYTRGNESDRKHYSTDERSNYYGRQDDRGYYPQTRRIEHGSNSGSKPHSATLMKKYIHQIRSGGKTIEGRINSGMFLKFKEGDTVRFFYMSNPADDVTCRITKVVKFSSFEQMLREEGVSKCLTDVTRLDDAIRIYDNIPGYRDKAARFGVLAIHLEVQR